MNEKISWSEKYRPANLEEVIFNNTSTKDLFQKMIDGKQMSNNLLLYGACGTGKSSCARVLANSLVDDFDLLTINGSKENDVDTMRDKIHVFATGACLNYGNPEYAPHRIVHIEEADYLSASSQAVLRDLMELCDEYNTCKFIFTCNYPDKLIDAIHSRCACLEFKTPDIEQVVERCVAILEAENVVFDVDVICDVVEGKFPDIRGVINELQFRSLAAEGIKADFISSDSNNKTAIYELLKNRKARFNIKEVQQLVANLSEAEISSVYKMLYDEVIDLFESDNQAILIIGEYMYRDASAYFRSINLTCCIASLWDVK